MIKAIIVDDELSSIKNLKWEIDTFCEDMVVVDSFVDPIEAISAINYIKPDCVFLDIEMPEMDGFQLLCELKYRDFDLIITTAYDTYALKAFKESAIGYLLKPIDTDDLKKAVEKIKLNKHDLGFDLKRMIDTFKSGENKQRIPLPLLGKTLFKYPDEILYCKSDGNYTTIFFTDETKEVFSKNLKELEGIIKYNTFCRVHNSYYVNTNHIKELVKKDGLFIVLIDETQIPVSRAKKENLINLLTKK